ncbi:acyltransferase family protein [Ornithinicoccus hortensis]|uniref:Peptidoglycan/LPS O-acetylase OafA/YrhL n=1 Tax=Ornithinicoccus hortensis TaxID=82346 RepID=A0A542YQ99_9MICO|nr:acyltransferase family protein [Ornithinicoccus hortensis]TQL50285.1 peptidoglycan/LPS O-acetylase OafA/YrhL [Ornithinicoccus hortensis]
MTGSVRGEVDSAREQAAGAHHGQRGKSAFRGDIEGLRAVAVGTVLIFHVGVPFMRGGFVGVDIFFVISGFLITSLLIREATATGRISLADFYARRARRLLPAASLVLLFTAVAGWLVLPGQDRANVGTDVVAATFYVVNWALAARSVDYLAEDAAPSAVQHYWSLSVEEQFYVVWPLLIILGLFLARRTAARPKPLLFGLLAVVAAASFVYSVRHTAADPATAYFFTTTRIWELAIGALLAFLVVRLTRLPRGLAELLAGVGLVLTVGSAFLLTTSTPWPGSAALAPTVGAALVIAGGCASQSTVTARLLSLRPMVWIGGLSYAIYLWHWPLLVLAKVWNPDLRIRHLALLGVLSVVLAWLTKHLVEDPIRFHAGLSAKAVRGLLFGLATMLVTALVGLAVWATVPKLDPDAPVEGATELIADPGATDWTLREDLSAVLTTTGEVTPDPAVAAADAPTYYDDDCQVLEGDPEINPDCVYGDPDGDRTLALLGDSKMGQWFPAVEYIAEQEGWRLELYLKSACAVTEQGAAVDCEEFTGNVLEHFAQEGAPDVALISQGSDRTGGGLPEGLTAALEEISGMGTQVVVLADSPRPANGQVYTCVEENPEDFSACAFDASGQGRDGRGSGILQDAANELDLPFLDLNEWICPPGDRCPPVIGQTLVYRQGSHVTASYIRSLTPFLYRGLATEGLTEREVGEITVEDMP